jgi:hypothetical protein
MNERIKELAEQAKCYADENSAHYLQNPHWIETFEEKFAELILNDVMSICEDLGDKGMDGHYCVDAIRKKYFGVEE